jgi:hypothetical protein
MCASTTMMVDRAAAIDRWGPQGEALILNIELDMSLSSLPVGDLTPYVTTLLEHKGSIAEAFRHADSLLGTLLCAGDQKRADVPLSRIVNLDSLMLYNLPPFKDRPLDDSTRSEALAELRTRPGDVQRRLTGTMGARPRDHFWLTPTAALAAALAAASSGLAAATARSALGLIHFGRGVHLARLDFPASYFQSLRVPTFIDGGSHPVFAIWKADRESGHTWHLDRHARGLPEFVSRDARLSPMVEISYLGRLETEAPRVDYRRLLGREPAP